ncbi:MAG: pyruvate formate lyase activating enzyme, partial [Halothiobacillaceae bacterium]
SGFFNYRRFCEQLLPHLDLIYFDLKLIDDQASRRYTGQSNRPVFDNFTRLVATATVPIVPRIPLIPGITATPENLGGIARFLDSLGIASATLLPYNPLWRDKIESLGRPLRYDRATFMTEPEIAAAVAAFYRPSSIQERPVIIA